MSEGWAHAVGMSPIAAFRATARVADTDGSEEQAPAIVLVKDGKPETWVFVDGAWGRLIPKFLKALEWQEDR